MGERKTLIKKCLVEECDNTSFCKGYCSSHYHRYVRYRDPLGGGAYRTPPAEEERCLIEGCNARGSRRGYCPKHLQELLRSGELRPKKIPNGDHVAQHPLYNSWRAMKDRCLTPTNQWYKEYGGRGIKICERWLSPYGFWNFVHDMGDKPSYEKGKGNRDLYSLDRIDVNGDYCPDNCRWANQSEQMNNTRRNRKLTLFGKVGSFTELYREFGVDGLKKKTAEARFYDHNWSLEKSITTPTVRYK